MHQEATCLVDVPPWARLSNVDQHPRGDCSSVSTRTRWESRVARLSTPYEHGCIHGLVVQQVSLLLACKQHVRICRAHHDLEMIRLCGLSPSNRGWP